MKARCGVDYLLDIHFRLKIMNGGITNDKGKKKNYKN